MEAYSVVAKSGSHAPAIMTVEVIGGGVRFTNIRWCPEAGEVSQTGRFFKPCRYIDRFGREVEGKLEIVKLTNGQSYVREVGVISAETGNFIKQIDNTIARLKNGAKFELENTGKYMEVGGHHPLAKSAFSDNFSTEVAFKQYYDEAFSVSVIQLEKFGGKGIHSKITGQQNSLYTAWRNINPNVKMTIDNMANIEIQAMVDKGIPQNIATGWVVSALEKLKKQNVRNISNIPWNGAN